MVGKTVLISGAGIAGLTLGVLLKEKGWDPTIIERESAIRTEGYVIDFFGTGWDVAERIGLAGELRNITYPIDSLKYIDATGEPYLSLPVASVREALDEKYTYLQRSDLERLLFDRAKAAGITIRFGTTIASLKDIGSEVVVKFEGGSETSFALVFGAGGVHSRVRDLVFGSESQFNRFLGYYVAAFHLANDRYKVGTSLNIFEEPERCLWVYSLGDGQMSAVYIFRHEDIGHVPPGERLPLLQKVYRGAGWIAETILVDHRSMEPIFFDAATQIVMPSWSKGRVALVGDACACLTLLAGQGSHFAMAEAYVIARELERYHGDHQAAFAAYERTLKHATVKKQREAVRISNFFVPSKHSIAPLRRFTERLLFNSLTIKYGLKFFGTKSVLLSYR